MYSTAISLLVTLTLLLASRPKPADAARSRRRPTRNTSPTDPSKYDRSITTFSSDGRLLQVEYGAIAAARGATVACLDLDCMGLKESGTNSGTRRRGVVVAVVRPNASGTSGSIVSHPQHLLLSDKVHRIDDHAILVTSGLSGDSRALASSAREGCQRLRLSYGESPTLEEIAKHVGSTQHMLTRIGGARPFGVTAAVIGVDPIPHRDMNGASADSDDEILLGTPSLYRTDPGGTLDRCDYCAAGKGTEGALQALENIMNDDHGTADADAKEQELMGIGGNGNELMANVIRKVALAALDADGVQSKFETEQDDEKGETTAEPLVDIWLIEACSKRRGGASFRVARAVKRKDLDDAASHLIGSEDDEN
mmetsp:Transcript_33320/g.73037  ORF Transcript_33320/g.73037 Transcript_33320/m.73037 type:complete len:367 (-) Transcript_33320:154-1254(-)